MSLTKLLFKTLILHVQRGKILRLAAKISRCASPLPPLRVLLLVARASSETYFCHLEHSLHWGRTYFSQEKLLL